MYRGLKISKMIVTLEFLRTTKTKNPSPIPITQMIIANSHEIQRGENRGCVAFPISNFVHPQTAPTIPPTHKK